MLVRFIVVVGRLTKHLRGFIDQLRKKLQEIFIQDDREKKPRDFDKWQIQRKIPILKNPLLQNFRRNGRKKLQLEK